MLEFCSNQHKSRDFYFDGYFLELQLDCVRTLLAHWVSRHMSPMNAMTWFSVASTDKICFVASEYLCYTSKEGNGENITTGCQEVLHSQTEQHGTETHRLATFLISYPALDIERTSNNQHPVKTSGAAAE